MAGVYIHIPFCTKACHYCDFHFSTNLELKSELVSCLKREIELQQSFLGDEIVRTIYLGGGTPSLLQASEVAGLVDTIRRTFNVAVDAEITLEANPDDLSVEKTNAFYEAGINRLSIGIQSFFEPVLAGLNRSHNARQAFDAVRIARDGGISNISIDLIYAIPGQTMEMWKENIEIVLSLKPPHISAYALTIEEKTAFGSWTRKGLFSPVDDDDAAEQMEYLVMTLTTAGYDHYEISNFAMPGYYSRHNSHYWQGISYLGIGPSAHSFKGNSRQHNVANNHAYIKSITEGRVPLIVEELGRHERVNDYVLTGLRTKWGIDLNYLDRAFGYDMLAQHASYLNSLVHSGLASLEGENLRLTEKGMFLADKISQDLFLIS